MGGFAAVVLAGGAARRMGGADKPALAVAGRPMLVRVLDAVTDATPRIVVGAVGVPVPADVLVTVETPPGGGPVAAVAAGLALVPPDVEVVALLAGDLPLLTRGAVGLLRSALSAAARSAPAAVPPGSADHPPGSADHPPGSADQGLVHVDGSPFNVHKPLIGAESLDRRGADAAGRPGADAAGRPGADAAGRPGADAAGRPGADAAGRPGADAAGRTPADGACYLDAAGRRQVLCGVWRTAALGPALTRLAADGAVESADLDKKRSAARRNSSRSESASPAGPAERGGDGAPGGGGASGSGAALAGASMRALLAGLVVVDVAWSRPGPPPWFDCDTEADRRRAEEWAG